MLRFLRKAARFLFWFVSISVLLVVAAVLVVLRWPGLVLNDRTLSRVATLGAVYLDRVEGVDLRWRSAGLRVESQSFLKKRIFVSFEGLCARQREDQYRACFEHFETAAVVDLGGVIPKLKEIGPTKLLGGDVAYDARVSVPTAPPPTKPSGPATPAKPGKPAFLADTHLRFVRVEVRRWQVRTQRDRVQGHLDLKSVERGDHLKFEINGSGEDSARGKKRKSISLAMEGTLALDRLALGLDATARNLLPELPRIAIRGCQLELKTETGKLDCPVNVAVPGLPVEVSKLDFPKSADLLIHAEARGKVFPPDLSKELDASLDVGLKHFSTRIFEGGGHVLARFHGTSAELSSRRGLQADLSLALRIPQFEEAVRALDDGKFAIPAPARALRGQIAFQAQGRADLGEGRFPFVLRSRMSSANQALNTDTTGALHFVTDAEGNTRVKLELDASLSDVKIELPRMELAKPPALTPDSRLVSASQKAREKSVPKSGSGAFDYEVHVVTPPGHPVKLLANLAKAPVPVQLDLKVSSQAPPSGTVSVENFPLELFHRDAALDHFKVVLRQPTELSPIDGELTVKYVDYTIKVLVLNTVGKPTVKLTSDPPLPENQLVAALLFGRPLEELDPSQGASVGSTRAALADGAIGLASLYVLASTPIQSVGYDPQTGVFSAKVRLAEGTSLNIGADTTSLAEVGVRKRLGAHWAITTGLEHPTDPTSRTLSALLEWSMRY